MKFSNELKPRLPVFVNGAFQKERNVLFYIYLNLL